MQINNMIYHHYLQCWCPKQLEKNNLKTTWKQLENNLKTTWKLRFSYLKTTWKQLENNLKTTWKQLENNLKTTWKQLENNLKTTWNQLENNLKSTWKQLENNLKQLENNLKQLEINLKTTWNQLENNLIGKVHESTITYTLFHFLCHKYNLYVLYTFDSYHLIWKHLILAWNILENQSKLFILILEKQVENTYILLP